MKKQLFYIFGPQGAGKGTQAKALMKYFSDEGYNNPSHVSSGEIFRKHIGEKTELGLEAKKYMDKGNLVPDELTVSMVVEFLKGLDNSEVIVMDGFPRTVNQHQKLFAEMSNLDAEFKAVILLEADEEIVVERLSGRRTCSNGHIFHVDYTPSKEEGICDDCGGELVQRDDDVPEAIKKRLAAYNEQTLPILSELEGDNVEVLKVDAEPPIKEVTEEMLSKLDEFLT